jgi:protein-disulfide isomerase
MLKPDVSAQDHAQGRHDARVTLVEYGDFECPHCARAYPIVKALQARFGDDLRFVFRYFPLLEAHPNAMAFAEFAEAAGRQGKFWQAHDYLFEHQGHLSSRQLENAAADLDLDSADLARALDASEPAKRVLEDLASGERNGVNGTPAFFINGVRFRGEWWEEAAFAEALASAGLRDSDRRAASTERAITSDRRE